MKKLSVGLLVVAVAIGGGCKKKDSATNANGSGSGSSGAGAAGAGGGSGSSSATGGTNSGTTTGTTASTQNGCVTKLGADLPQGDIKLTAACGPVTVEGEVTIDAKLTIEPGVTLSFVDGATLNLGYNNPSSLIAQGTADKPITFTAATTKSAGGWKGIRLYNHDTKSELDHVILEDAGADGDDGAGLRVDDGVKELSITNTQIRSIKGIGLRVDGEKALTKLANNMVKDTSAAAMRINPDNLPVVDQNVVGDRVIEITGGRISKSATLHAPATYRLLADLTVERAENNQPVPVLTIEPGVTVEATSDGSIAISYNNAGGLVAKGTADKPIKFTGFDKKKGSWKGIHLYQYAQDVVIQNATIEYADSSDDTGALRIDDNATADVEDVTFAHLDGFGLTAPPASKLTAKNLKSDDAKGTQPKPQP